MIAFMEFIHLLLTFYSWYGWWSSGQEVRIHSGHQAITVIYLFIYLLKKIFYLFWFISALDLWFILFSILYYTSAFKGNRLCIITLTAYLQNMWLYRKCNVCICLTSALSKDIWQCNQSLMCKSWLVIILFLPLFF